MFARCVAVALLFSCGLAAAAPAEEYQFAEIVKFTDFDDLEIKLDGKAHKAFLVGLRPIRETVKGKKEQDRVRNTALAEFKKSELVAQVVTRRGEVLGLSIDAYAHRKHGFHRDWDPSKYPYCCWTGWGAYNFNTYFLYTKLTTFQDNFGENKLYRTQFVEVVKKIEGKDKK